MLRILRELLPVPPPRAHYQTLYSKPSTARTLLAGKQHAPTRRRDLPPNSLFAKTVRRATANTMVSASRPPARWLLLVPRRSAILCPRRDGICHALVHLFGEWSPRLCRHSSLARCRFYPEDAAEARASAPENVPPAPCRIAKSLGVGCPRAQWQAGKSSSARLGANDSPCARKTFLSAHTGRNRTAPSQWHSLRLPLHLFVFPRRPPWKRVSTGASRGDRAPPAPVESLPACPAGSRSSTAFQICGSVKQRNGSANPSYSPAPGIHHRASQSVRSSNPREKCAPALPRIR